MRIVIFFILLFITIFASWAISPQDLEGKSENELYNMAVDYYNKFDDKSAYIVCAYIIKNVNPRNRYAFYLLSEILIRNITSSSDKQKIYNEILKYADYVINNIDYYDARAYYYKGWVYFSMGDYASSEVNLKKSLQNDPYFLPSLRLLLDLYINKKNFDDALDVAKKILDRGYINKDFAYLIFRLYVESDKLDEAKKFADKYQSFLNDDKSFYLLSLLNYNLGNYNVALDFIEKALSSFPDNLDYLKLKVKILYSQKRYKEAYDIIKQRFADTKDDEILIIKKEIEASNFRNIFFIVLGFVIIMVIGVFILFYIKEKKIKEEKISIQNIKKKYQETVSVKAENLDILVSLIQEFFNENILSEVRNFTSFMAIYVSDPRKDNVMYLYVSSRLFEVPDVLYIYPKYSAWLSEYANTPVHLMELQNNNIFYEWFGGKNITMFKKQRLLFLIPCMSRGLLQCVIFIGAKNEEEEQSIIQVLRKYKEVIGEVAEEIANDVISVRFKEAAILDELTRLYNRRFMYQKMEEEIGKASKTNQKISFILCDIDNFKKFNDTYGHQVGDEVLRAVARVFKGVAREFFDWPFRYGGEEIGIILPNTPTDKAFEIAERVRTEVSSQRFENVPTIITISLGLATYPDHGKSIDEIIKAADEALYYSKRTGKNKTTIAGVKVLSEANENKNEVVKETSKSIDFKIPSFVYSLEQFEEYYASVRSNYKHKILTIETTVNESLEKMVMEIYHELMLVESMGMKMQDNKVIIKILLIERSEEDIQKIVNDISSKYNVKPSIETKI